MRMPSFIKLTAVIVFLSCCIVTNCQRTSSDRDFVHDILSLFRKPEPGVNPPTRRNPVKTQPTVDNEIFDLCIVGGGMFGSAAARHASEMSGVKVCLIGPDEPTPEERPTREIFASYYDQARIIDSVFTNQQSQMLALPTMGRLKQLEGLSGINFYSPVGSLLLSKEDTEFTEKIIINRAKMSKLPVVDVSSDEIFQKRFPYLHKMADDSVLLEDFGAGTLNPRNFVAASKKVAQIQGCTLIKKIVDEVKPLINGTHEIITEDGEVVKARKVLFCTGFYTNFKKFSIPKLKINIIKDTAVLFKLPSEEVKRLSAMPAISYERLESSISVYILPPIQYPDGSYYIKIGTDMLTESFPDATIESIREWYLNPIGNPAAAEMVTDVLLSVLPGLKYDDIKILTCATSVSPTGAPYIDRITPTLSVAVVGNGGGARFADEVGRLAAVYSLTGKWDSDLSSLLFRAVLDNNNPMEPII